MTTFCSGTVHHTRPMLVIETHRIFGDIVPSIWEYSHMRSAYRVISAEEVRPGPEVVTCRATSKNHPINGENVTVIQMFAVATDI